MSRTSLTRRDFFRASAAVAAAFGLDWSRFGGRAYAAAGSGQPVVWLQAQGCSGCSVSLLNSISLASVGDLVENTLNLEYHPTLMASAGAAAVAQAVKARGTSGYVLVVEGSVPTGANGAYCTLWPGMTALEGVKSFAPNAAFILAVGSCSAFGGMPGGSPNPTSAQPLSTLVGTSKLINIPGCPSHPDWIVGTIAYLLKNGRLPELAEYRRPKMFFEKTVHERCPYKDNKDRCMFPLGCRGKETRCDCPVRKWNAGAAGGIGVNWCIGPGRPNGSPCLGCTEPKFPDGMSPFHLKDRKDFLAGDRRNLSADGAATEADAAPQTAAPQTAAPEPAEVAAGDSPTVGAGPQRNGQTNYAARRQKKRAEYEQQLQERRRQYEERRAAGRALYESRGRDGGNP